MEIEQPADERRDQEGSVDDASEQKGGDIATRRREELPDRIYVYKRWCKSCGICAEFCPPHCLEMGSDGIPFLARPEECIDCGWCEIRCPDFAITNNPRRKRPKKAEAAA
jgi:2-oxoglutarate ferredoxin oxidoreductase subunit delta